jgi:uncharacterized protein (DUF433 family)
MSQDLRRRPARWRSKKVPGRTRSRVVREGQARPIEGTVSTTMRLRRSVRTRLEAWAERARRSVSELAQELIEEGICMRECPGIYFAAEPSGRTAKIAGTGLAVWEVLRDFVHDQDVERLRRAYAELSHAQVTAALMYYTRYPEIVTREVETNAALTPEALERRYPGLVRPVRIG